MAREFACLLTLHSILTKTTLRGIDQKKFSAERLACSATDQKLFGLLFIKREGEPHWCFMRFPLSIVLTLDLESRPAIMALPSHSRRFDLDQSSFLRRTDRWPHRRRSISRERPPRSRQC